MYEFKKSTDRFLRKLIFYKIFWYFAFKLPSPDFPSQFVIVLLQKLAAVFYNWRSKEKFGKVHQAISYEFI